MRRFLFSISFFSMVVMIACDTNDGLSGDLVNGKINGEEWQFQYAKVFYSFNNEYEVEMYGQHERETDPCAINSINSYISVTLPGAEGVYTLPFAQENGSLKFHLPGVGQQFYVANSGFIEIISISGRRIAGYLQAGFDEDNTVEGTFIFDRCN